MIGYKVRTADKRDITLLIPLVQADYLESLRGEITPDAVSQTLSRFVGTGGDIWVTVDSTELQGFGMGRVQGEHYRVERIYITPEVRHQHGGTALLTEQINLARDVDARTIFAEVEHCNAIGLVLLTHHQFRITHEKDRTIARRALTT